MNPVHQYINNKTGERYYYTPYNICCDTCEVKLDFVALYLCWGKKKSFAKRLCFDCSKKHEQETEAQEKIILGVVNKKPKNSTLVLITQPVLRPSSKDDSLFSNTLETDYVNNQAPRSGHPVYTVLDDSAPVLIGKSIDEEREAEKDKLLDSKDELDSLLLGFKNEQVLIGNDEEEEKKLIE